MTTYLLHTNALLRSSDRFLGQRCSNAQWYALEVSMLLTFTIL
ncbi:MULTISPECIES: hypothetical protein [Cyanophyceae]|nr:hypothetical protein [Trichocoleus sp. FACHB-69]